MLPRSGAPAPWGSAPGCRADPVRRRSSGCVGCTPVAFPSSSIPSLIVVPRTHDLPWLAVNANYLPAGAALGGVPVLVPGMRLELGQHALRQPPLLRRGNVLSHVRGATHPGNDRRYLW